MHIGINAHLLSADKGYRAAGIHGYLYHTLAHLHRAAPGDWQFTAMVGIKNRADFDGVQMQRAPFDTERPVRRILWEQLVQPAALPRFDLYHAGAFVAPVWPLKPPFVVTVYDLSFVHYPQVLSTARRAYLSALTTHTCRRARRVIAISESTARDVIETFNIPPDRVDVAVPGTDFERFRPLPEADVAAFRREKNLPERFWLFLGTLEPRKNLPTLLEAYARLEDPPLLVLGGGKGWDYLPIFETIERLNLQKTVRTPGFIPSAELPLWYNSADIFLYPSVFEGFGLPVLEAMACGTAVILSDTSSLPEVAGRSHNLRVPPHDLDAWEDALRTAYDNFDWRMRAAQSGLEEARQFTWDQTAAKTIESYRRAFG